jgi:uncharacterized membrane protein YedE/YeeE
MIEICLLTFGVLLLLGSIGAFFLYIPFLSIAVVVVILLGMALIFLIGVLTGGTRALRMARIKQRIRRLRLRQDTAENPAVISDEMPLELSYESTDALSAPPLPLAAPLDE